MFGLPNSLLQIGVELFDFRNVHRDLSALLPRSDADARDTKQRERLSREHVVHGARRLLAGGIAHHLGRHARHGDVVRHRLQHHRSRRDARAAPDLDVADDAGARPRSARRRRSSDGGRRGPCRCRRASRRAASTRCRRSSRSRRPQGRWRGRGRCRGRPWPPDGCRTGTRRTSGSEGNRRSPCGPCSRASAQAGASEWRGSPCSRAPAR